jgi:RHS repeat-associated protein
MRDDGGRITQKSETIAGESHTYGYGYDGAGRLNSVTRDGANVASYAYDSNSNRLPGTYDDQDRMIAHGGATYTYTGNGELASKTELGATTTYTYDELGNLIKVALPSGKLIEYVIDGENRRVGKKIAGILVRQWLYSGPLHIAAELDGTGGLISQFVYGGRPNVPDYMIHAGKTYRFISDQLGSPRLIVDSTTGTVVERMDFGEFGNVLGDTAPGFQPFGFAGGLYDPDTKLVRFGARDYDPQVGRWTAKDPIDFAGGDTNLFAYVFNQPVNLVDPNGLEIRRCFRQFGSPRDLYLSSIAVTLFPSLLAIQPPVPGVRAFLGHEYLYNTRTRTSMAFDPARDRPESGNDLCYTIPEPLGQCVWNNFTGVAGPRENYNLLTNNCQITINRTVSVCRQLLSQPPGTTRQTP